MKKNGIYTTVVDIAEIDMTKNMLHKFHRMDNLYNVRYFDVPNHMHRLFY